MSHIHLVEYWTPLNMQICRVACCRWYSVLAYSHRKQLTSIESNTSTNRKTHAETLCITKWTISHTQWTTIKSISCFGLLFLLKFNHLWTPNDLPPQRQTHVWWNQSILRYLFFFYLNLRINWPVDLAFQK